MNERSPLQFGILSLLVLMTLSACFLAATVVVGRASGLGEQTALMIVLSRQIFRLPVILVWLVGGAIVANRCRRHPRVVRCAVAGLLGMFVLSLFSSIADVWIQGVLRTSGPAMIGYILYGKAFVECIVLGGCWVFVLIAIAADRSD